jgi:flagellar hook assembly protein FlgD
MDRIEHKKHTATYRYYWNGKDDSGNVVGSGLYFVHIQAGGGLQKDKEDCCGEIRMTNVEVIA